MSEQRILIDEMIHRPLLLAFCLLAAWGISDVHTISVHTLYNSEIQKKALISSKWIQGRQCKSNLHTIQLQFWHNNGNSSPPLCFLPG